MPRRLRPRRDRARGARRRETRSSRSSARSASGCPRRTRARPRRTSSTPRRCSSRRRARLIPGEIAGVADACARLADEHRATVMPARTLLQQAVPTTFGLKAAVWLDGGRDRRRTARRVAADARSSAARRERSRCSARRASTSCAHTRLELGLAEPAVPWHATRGPVRELVDALERSRRPARRSRSTSCCSRRPRWARFASPRAAARRRCRTSGTRPAQSWRARARSACTRSRARSTRRTSTSARPAPGTRSGRRSRDLLALTGARRVPRARDARGARGRRRADAREPAGRGDLGGGEGVAPEDYLGSASAFVDRALARLRDR